MHRKNSEDFNPFDSDSDSEADIENLKGLIEQAKSGLKLAKMLVDTIEKEAAKLSDEDKKSEFYVNLNRNSNLQVVFKEFNLAELKKQRAELDRLFDRYDAESLGFDEKAAKDAIDRSIALAEKCMKLIQKIAVAEIKVLAHQIERKPVHSTVTFVPDFLQATDASAVQAKPDSVDNINRMFAQMRLEREKTEAVEAVQAKSEGARLGVRSFTYLY